MVAYFIVFIVTLGGFINHQASADGQKFGIYGAGFSKGQHRFGVDTGPSVLRKAGLVEYLQQEEHADLQDYGDLPFHNPKERVPVKPGSAKSDIWNVAEVSDANKKIFDQADKIIKDGRTPIILGGDHSIAIGSMQASAKHYPNMSIIYIDAHADINTVKTTPSGNIHGMTLPFIIEELNPEMADLKEFSWTKGAIPVSRVGHIALRSVDEGEQEIIKKLKVNSYGMRDVDRLGIVGVVNQLIEKIRVKGGDGEKPCVHVSFDIDSLDDREIGAMTGTPEPGGLSVREALVMFEEIKDKANIVSFDVTELNVKLGGPQPETVQERLMTILKYLVGCVVGQCRGGTPRQFT